MMKYIMASYFTICSVLDLLFEVPLVIFELIQFVSLPVDRVYALVHWICDCWHLEREYVVLQFRVGFSDCVVLCVQEESLIRELTMETSNYDDFRVTYFANATALAWTQQYQVLDL